MNFCLSEWYKLVLQLSVILDLFERSKCIRLIKEMINVWTPYPEHLKDKMQWLKLAYKHLVTGEALKTEPLLAKALQHNGMCVNYQCKMVTILLTYLKKS